MRSTEKFDCASSSVVSFGNCGSTPVQQSVVKGQYGVRYSGTCGHWRRIAELPCLCYNRVDPHRLDLVMKAGAREEVSTRFASSAWRGSGDLFDLWGSVSEWGCGGGAQRGVCTVRVQLRCRKRENLGQRV